VAISLTSCAALTLRLSNSVSAKDPAARWWRRWGRFTLLTSVPLMIEYQAVMTRPEHLKASGSSVDDVDVLLDAVAAVIEPVRVAFLWLPVARDQNDDMVLEAPGNGQADAIVTFNIRDFGQAAVRFGIKVLSLGEAWKQVEKGKRGRAILRCGFSPRFWTKRARWRKTRVWRSTSSSTWLWPGSCRRSGWKAIPEARGARRHSQGARHSQARR
jgi:predicted nucleic acid-binding protein